jgi:hypothetical protein
VASKIPDSNHKGYQDDQDPYIKQEVNFIRASNTDKLILNMTEYFNTENLSSVSLSSNSDAVTILQPFSGVFDSPGMSYKGCDLLDNSDEYGYLVMCPDNLFVYIY